MPQRLLVSPERGIYPFPLLRALLIALCATQLTAVPAQSATQAPPRIDGCWSLTFETPTRRLHVLTDVAAHTNGEVVLTVIGPAYGEIGRILGTRNGDHLRFRYDLLRIPLDVTMGITRNKLEGTWSGDGKSGKVSARRVHLRSVRFPHPELFQSVWECTNAHFYDPRFNGVNWAEIKESYLPRANQTRTDAELVVLIREMLGELKVSHLDFYYEPDLPVTEYVNSEVITHRKVSPRIGYLGIRDFDPSSAEEAADRLASLHDALRACRDLPALVIDVRGNSGGTLEHTLRVIDCFLATEQTVLYVATRQSLLAHQAERMEQLPWAELPVLKNGTDGNAGRIVAGGVGGPCYEGRLAVLINEDTGSGGEIFAAVLRENRAAHLIGRKTAGCVLGAQEGRFSKNQLLFDRPTRWRLSIPSLDFRTARMRSLEGNGLDPDLVAGKNGSTDVALEKAVAWLSQRDS